MSNLEQDREWGPLLLIIRFLDKKAGKGLMAYVDMERQTVNINGLLDQNMSSGEKFLINLAAHLFNCADYPLPHDGLGDMDVLGGEHLAVALKAIAMRFGGG